VRWQEKAWVDRPVMVDIAKDFVKFKKEKHGDDSVLLICDNLDAHCHEKSGIFLELQISWCGIVYLVALI